MDNAALSPSNGPASRQSDEPPSFEPLREASLRDELARRIARANRGEGSIEPIPGLHLNRSSRVTMAGFGVTTPSFCVIAQGSKEIRLGDVGYRYDPCHYLLATVQLPALSRIVEASPERPYLSLRLNLDPALVASVMLDADISPPRRDNVSVRAVDVSALDTSLLDAAVRLVRLVEAPPTEARMLLPLVKREIIFRLLIGDQSARLRQLAVLGGQTDRVARAIDRLRQDFDKPLRIEHLAREVGMSPSGFHEHFKTVTAMSPLQFQKQLRLQEARRLLLGEDVDATTVAFRVGYEDASHFSREYKRLFGQPPMRDVERLRGAATAEL